MVNINQIILNVCIWILLGLILWCLVVDDRKITALEDGANATDTIHTCTVIAYR